MNNEKHGLGGQRLDTRVDATIANEIVIRVNMAKDRLWALMRARGLTQSTGWRISEMLRETDAGTTWVLSPVHAQEAAPDLETLVELDSNGRPL